MDQGVFSSKRVKLDIDNVNDDVIIISNSSSISNIEKNSFVKVDISMTNTSTLPVVSTPTVPKVETLNKLISLPAPTASTVVEFVKLSAPPIVTIDDDDIVEVAVLTKNSDFCKSQTSLSKVVVSKNIDPIIINLSPSASSSECPSPKKQAPLLHRNPKKTIHNFIVNKWSHQYCVTIDPTVSLIFEPITSYKRRFDKEFNKFNKQIWNHLSSNLQVSFLDL